MSTSSDCSVRKWPVGKQESPKLLQPESPSLSVLTRQIRQGLSREDLAAVGGELSVDDRGDLWLPRRAVDSHHGLEQIAAALLSQRGERKIWLLGQAESPRGCRVFNFAAGRVMDCYVDGRGILIVIQPCQLPTCTAMVRRGMPRNPWLGKIHLCR